MSFKLWNFYDSFDIENLIIRHNLNKIKIVLYPLEEGYEIFMKVNDKEESMYFTYQDSRVLDSIDYGLLPTTILSGLCQAKEQYLYSNYVIVEIFDRRYQIRNNDIHASEIQERKYLTVLRITDNSIMKLTGIKSRLGDLREEQQWVARNVSKINLNLNKTPDSDDGFNFMNSEWFQRLLQKKHVAKILHRKQGIQWNSATDGEFHYASLHNIQNQRLKKHISSELLIKNPMKSEEIVSNYKIQLNDEAIEKISKLLENQKQTIFKTNPHSSMKLNDCHEECVHQMIIRSPLSGSNFKLILSRCPLHNRHWGHLIVDQWEGSSTKPIRFELPGGFGQGRRLLNQLSEMLGAKVSMNIESNNVDSNSTDLNTSPKLSETSSNMKPNSNDTIWESIESIMTKNIQSGKPLYDNRDTVNSSLSIYGNSNDGSSRKKKSMNVSKNKLPSNNADVVYQTSKSNASIKAASMNGELQQKQSLYSLKDLNLDDLF